MYVRTNDIFKIFGSFEIFPLSPSLNFSVLLSAFWYPLLALTSYLHDLLGHRFVRTFCSSASRPLNVPSSLFSDANSRHPLLELNLQRPVYRNYRLLMNGTLYIHKVRTISFIISHPFLPPVIFQFFDFLSSSDSAFYHHKHTGRGGRRGAVPLRGGERCQRAPRRRRQPQSQR